MKRDLIRMWFRYTLKNSMIFHKYLQTLTTRHRICNPVIDRPTIDRRTSTSELVKLSTYCETSSTKTKICWSNSRTLTFNKPITNQIYPDSIPTSLQAFAKWLHLHEENFPVKEDLLINLGTSSATDFESVIFNKNSTYHQEDMTNGLDERMYHMPRTKEKSTYWVSYRR